MSRGFSPETNARKMPALPVGCTMRDTDLALLLAFCEIAMVKEWTNFKGTQ
jgi:hypothetical protein